MIKVRHFIGLLLLLLVSCTPHAAEEVPLKAISLKEGEKLRVVATTSIVADVVHNVGGDLINLTTLLPLGADPHSFQPTPKDVATVSKAHVVMANGAGLEGFLESLLKNAGKVPVVHLSEGLTLRSGEEHQEHGDHEHSTGDPHTWTNPANVIVFAQNAAQALSTLDPAHAAVYQANAENYRRKLEELDAWIAEQIASIPPERRKLVSDHLTFGYYAERYGLEIVGAVLPSYSTAAQASAKELAALQNAIREHGVRAILVGMSVNPALAERLAQDTGIKVVRVYHGSLGPAGSGAEDYLAYMRYNTLAIVEALR